MASDLAFRAQRYELAWKLTRSARVTYERAGDAVGVGARFLRVGDFRSANPELREQTREDYARAAEIFAAASAVRGIAAIACRNGYLATLSEDFATAVRHYVVARDQYAACGDWLAHDGVRAFLLLARIGSNPLDEDTATAQDIGAKGLLARSFSHAHGELNVRLATWRSLIAYARKEGARQTVIKYAQYMRDDDEVLRRLEAFTFPTPPLDFARLEAEVVAAGFPNVALRCDASATRDEVMTLLPNSRLVHLATHGILVGVAPSLSCVLLANGERLTIEDVVNDLRVESNLIVLSACQTGVVTVGLGNDALSLPPALLTAGARALIVTLWSVDDVSSGSLMWRFYKNYATAPIASGLAEAQNWLHNLQASEILDVLSLWSRLPLSDIARARLDGLESFVRKVYDHDGNVPLFEHPRTGRRSCAPDYRTPDCDFEVREGITPGTR